MKLHSNPASPYVRKVRVLAIETGLIERIELVPKVVSPIQPNTTVYADNPIGKIPILVLDDGNTLFDSRVICEYLDTLHTGTRAFPENGEHRWIVLRYQAVADGILDAALNTRYESFLRPEQFRWPEWIEGQKGKYRHVMDVLETEVKTFEDNIDIGVISVACALGYLDFRFPDEGWRDKRPNLSRWYEEFRARPSMMQTQHEDHK